MRTLLWLASSALVGLIFWSVAACDDNGADGDGDADTDTDADVVEECGEVGASCDMSPECAADDRQVCVGHVCDCAVPRRYKVEVYSAAIYARAPGGHCWDGVEPDGCTDPDPYAIITVGDEVYTTVTKRDTINPLWNENFEVLVQAPPATTYGVQIFDDDSEEEEVEDREDGDDLIMDFPVLFWLDYNNLRQGGIEVKQGTDAKRTVIKLSLTPLPNQ